MVELPAIEVVNLQVAYGSNLVLDSVSLAIEQKKITGVIGPNGAGKSTFLKAVLGLVPVLAGEIHVLGQKVAKSQKRISYIAQRSSIDWDFPVTVRDLVTTGSYGRLGWIRRPGAKEYEQVTNALNRLEILELEHCQIGELSGGQQQRVFLARALVQDAPVYFMDEPFNGIDIKTEEVIVGLIRQLRDEGKSFVIVHHDLATAGKYMDSIALLNRRIIAFGPTGETLSRKNLELVYGGSFTFLDQE
ncbi:MAG: metal ABC transporter ATP-binding protein [Planctomycetota bacterium]